MFKKNQVSVNGRKFNYLQSYRLGCVSFCVKLHPHHLRQLSEIWGEVFYWQENVEQLHHSLLEMAAVCIGVYFLRFTPEWTELCFAKLIIPPLLSLWLWTLPVSCLTISCHPWVTCSTGQFVRKHFILFFLLVFLFFKFSFQGGLMNKKHISYSEGSHMGLFLDVLYIRRKSQEVLIFLTLKMLITPTFSPDNQNSSVTDKHAFIIWIQHFHGNILMKCFVK